MDPTTKYDTRRDFLKQSVVATGIGASLPGLVSSLRAKEFNTSKKLRVAIVGTGSRCVGMWGPPVEKEFSDRVEIVGLCDINPKRVKYVQSLFEKKLPTFTDFDEMIRVTKPTSVIITTVDAFHIQYAVRAMELGCDVICEKPLATNAEDCQRLHDVEKQTGQKVTVTFNARYFGEATKVKELLLSGVIGKLYSVDYAELLNLDHGASYFRRWHGLKALSGTLLCTKASHHFDQVNWWADSAPAVVSAYGDLKEYGSNGNFRSTHCRVCPHQADCKHYWDITKSDKLMKLYVDSEDQDGYLRDGCLYREEIDIYDTMSLQCRYQNDVLLTYSLNAASPIEGQIIALNGSNGRIELRAHKKQPWTPDAKVELRLITNDPNESRIIPIEQLAGGHGGADPALKRHVFLPESKDPLNCRAGSKAGIHSSIVGIAGYMSIASGKPVRVNDIINLS